MLTSCLQSTFATMIVNASNNFLMHHQTIIINHLSLSLFQLSAFSVCVCLIWLDQSIYLFQQIYLLRLNQEEIAMC